MLPERHQWKLAVQAAAVMLRTPPSPAGHRPVARAHPAERSHYDVITRDGRKLVTRVHVVAIATQSVHRLRICPIVHNYGASPTTTPSYIRVRAVVWACGRGQTDRQTHRHA